VIEPSEVNGSSDVVRVTGRDFGIDALMEMMRQDENFAMSRWGDGEWNAVLDRRTRGVNTDGHSFAPELGEELRQVLQKRPPYLLGLAAWERVFGSQVHDWLVAEGLHDLDWISANIFFAASVKGRLGEFISALQERPAWILVGPQHLGAVQEKLGFTKQIVVPQDCFSVRDEILKQSLQAAARLPLNSVVTISAGMTANLLVHGIFKQVGDRLTIIDTGSVWDPYAGVFSRSYMREESFSSRFEAQ